MQMHCINKGTFQETKTTLSGYVAFIISMYYDDNKSMAKPKTMKQTKRAILHVNHAPQAPLLIFSKKFQSYNKLEIYIWSPHHSTIFCRCIALLSVSNNLQL